MQLNNEYRHQPTFCRSFLIAAFLLAASITASAATITVTNLNDSGPGSLRRAIADASSGDTIDFAVTGTITLTSGQLVIGTNLTIQGPGASLLSISGNNASRVFYINNGTATLDGLTITGGREGCVGNGCQGPSGGGIYNLGMLTVRNSRVIGNETYADCDILYSCIVGDGGGIANMGLMTISNSTLSGNGTLCLGSAYNCEALYGGGAIYNASGLIVSDSTISFNITSAIANSGGFAVSNSTISDNPYDVTLYGGTTTLTNSVVEEIAFYNSGTVTLTNTIVSGIYGGNVSSASHNLVSDALYAGGIQNGVNGNIVGADPMLGPLADNGGPTWTHALMPGSPAINAGDNCVLIENGCGYTHPALSTDQRGFLRTGNVDMGAFESSGVWPCNSRRRIGFPVPNCG